MVVKVKSASTSNSSKERVIDAKLDIDVSTLSDLPPLSNLSDDKLKALVELATVRQHPNGSTYFHEGDKADKFYLLVSGFARTIRSTQDGEQMVTLLIPPGHLLGVSKVIEHETYPFTAKAASDGITLSWPTHLWARFSQEYPRLVNIAHRTVGERIGELQDRIVELGTKRAEQRIAATVLRLAEKAGETVDEGIRISFPLSRQDISEMTGSTLHTVSRVMSSWSRDGIISSRRKQVTLRSRDMLEKIVLTQAA